MRVFMDTIVEIKKTFYESFHGHHCRNKGRHFMRVFMDTIVEIKKTFYESFHGHHCRNKEDIL